MEPDNAKPRKSFLQTAREFAGIVLIITIATFILESILKATGLESWKEVSEKIGHVNKSLLSFTRQLSPVGFADAYSGNIANYRYSTYFYGVRSPFNLTKACIALQKRVYHVPARTGYPGAIDNMLDEYEGKNPKAVSDDTALYYTMDRASVYPRDPVVLAKEPAFLCKACNLDIMSPDVVVKARGSFEKILSVPDSLLTWLGRSWHHPDRTANWPGRVLLILFLLFSFVVCSGIANSVPNIKTGRMILYFMGLVLVAMLVFSLVSLTIYGILTLVNLVGNGVHQLSVFVSGLGSIGAFIKLYFKEAASHFGFEAKTHSAVRVKNSLSKNILTKRK